MVLSVVMPTRQTDITVDGTTFRYGDAGCRRAAGIGGGIGRGARLHAVSRDRGRRIGRGKHRTTASLGDDVPPLETTGPKGG